MVCSDALQGTARRAGIGPLQEEVGVRGATVAGSAGRLVVDIRAFDPAHRRTLIFTIMDKMCELGCQDEILFVTDHEPSGIGYQIDLRRETRGRFEYAYNQRSDGAWVAMITRKRTHSEA